MQETLQLVQQAYLGTVASRRHRAGGLGYRGQGRRGAPARLGARSAQLQGACDRRAQRPGKVTCTTCSASGNGCRSMARSSCSTVPGTAASWSSASRALPRHAEWHRAYDEINDFERMLLADGTRLVKLFLHITPEEQLRRFRARLTDPLKRWKLSYEDFRNRGRWQEYEEAIEDMVEKTSTRRAPWHLIPPTTSRSAGWPRSASSPTGCPRACHWSRARSIPRWPKPPRSCSASACRTTTTPRPEARRRGFIRC